MFIFIIFQGKRPTISTARTVYFIRDSDGTTLRDGGFYMAGGEHMSRKKSSQQFLHLGLIIIILLIRQRLLSHFDLHTSLSHIRISSCLYIGYLELLYVGSEHKRIQTILMQLL
jgi:hypothetical protein